MGADVLDLELTFPASVWESAAAGGERADDAWLFVELAGCSLNKSPKKNWVDNVGGLPEYICRIARAIVRSGKSVSAAIRIAVGTVRNWASGQKNVNADTRAKAAKAIAEWEAKKAKSHAQTAAKKAKKVAASMMDGSIPEPNINDPAQLLYMSGSSHSSDIVALCGELFNMDDVRSAWNQQRHNVMNVVRPEGYDGIDEWVEQVWSRFLIVRREGNGQKVLIFKVPFGVLPDGAGFLFGEPVEVVPAWLETISGQIAAPGQEVDGELDPSDDLNDMLDLAVARLLARDPFTVALAAAERR